MIDEALRRAGVGLSDLGAVAVATRPGLVGALVVGLTAAKTLALALDIPLIAVDHLEGHLYACQLAFPDRQVYPCVGLVVSGGHTSLYHCRGPLDCELLGGTIDDAAGEAFDKVASLLGLGYPGGPEIERARKERQPQGLRLPTLVPPRRPDWPSASPASRRPSSTRSGGRTRNGAPSSRRRRRSADLAASFQEAVVDVLVAKTREALKQTGLKRLGVGGGVAANARFRQKLTEMAETIGVQVFIPPMSLCTDNAAMAGIALVKLAAGQDVGPGRRRRRRPGPTGPEDLSVAASVQEGGRRRGRWAGSHRACLDRLAAAHRGCVAGRGPGSGWPECSNAAPGRQPLERGRVGCMGSIPGEKRQGRGSVNADQSSPGPVLGPQCL